MFGRSAAGNSRQRVRAAPTSNCAAYASATISTAMPWRANKSLTVSSTGAALETYLSGFDCETDTALRVNGKEWVAVTKVDEVATAMVQTGGEMDLFGRLTRDMTSTAPAAFPG